MKVDGEVLDGKLLSDWEQCINMKEAIHQTRFVYANKLEVSYSICALRSMPYAGLVRVNVKALVLSACRWKIVLMSPRIFCSL